MEVLRGMWTWKLQEAEKVGTCGEGRYEGEQGGGGAEGNVGKESGKGVRRRNRR